jgi:hypothetical protein
MLTGWWGMPGPHAALDDAVMACEEGRSVALAVPQSCAGGWTRRIHELGGRRVNFEVLRSDVGKSSDPDRRIRVR